MCARRTKWRLSEVVWSMPHETFRTDRCFLRVQRWLHRHDGPIGCHACWQGRQHRVCTGRAARNVSQMVWPRPGASDGRPVRCSVFDDGAGNTTQAVDATVYPVRSRRQAGPAFPAVHAAVGGQMHCAAPQRRRHAVNTLRLIVCHAWLNYYFYLQVRLLFKQKQLRERRNDES